MEPPRPWTKLTSGIHVLIHLRNEERKKSNHGAMINNLRGKKINQEKKNRKKQKKKATVYAMDQFKSVMTAMPNNKGNPSCQERQRGKREMSDKKRKKRTTKERIYVKKISECKQGALQIVNGSHNNTPDPGKRKKNLIPAQTRQRKYI